MNPLMQMMSRPMGNMMGNIQQIQSMMQMLRGQNPAAVMQQLAQKNPQFAQFMQSCQGKSPEQVCQEYGVDPGAFYEMLKMMR